MKFLCLDVGEKRIGVAVADTSVKIAIPHSVIFVDGNEFQQIAHTFRLEKADLLVVGLPRNSKGEETAQSKAIRTFIIALQDYFVKHNLETPRIYFQDESLTSVMAAQNLARSHRRKPQKGDIDREAATLILQDFIESFRPESAQNKTPAQTKRTAQRNSTPSQPQTKPKSSQNPKKTKKSVLKKILAFIIVVILLIGASLASYVYFSQPVLNPTACNNENKAPCEGLEFYIETGESSARIAERLEREGLIRSKFIFRLQLMLEGQSIKIKAGTHHLKATYSPSEIIGILTSDPAAKTFSLTIIPGETLYSIRAKFKNLGFTDADIDSAFSKQYDHPLLKDRPIGVSIEGYIYGETYEFYADASLDQILSKTFDHFYEFIQTENLEEKFAAQGFNLHEAITLASVVQREAQAADQAQVAQVFLLRLQKGMALGSDAITAYAADQIDPNRDKSNMSYLKTLECPWNSRLCQGLPPHPIATPSKSALISTAEPAPGDYLYFLMGDDGQTHYARTDEGHQKNIKNYCGKRCQVL